MDIEGIVFHNPLDVQEVILPTSAGAWSVTLSVAQLYKASWKDCKISF